MGIKDELIKLKSSLLSTKNVEIDNTVDKFISLDTLVEDFINWYFEVFVKEQYSDMGELRFATDMRNFIEKVAVWYELRYPDYEINKMMYCSGQEGLDINDIMFKENNYINSLFDKDSYVRRLDWSKFYNKETFINSLSWDNRYYFNKPKYNSVIYLDPVKSSAHLHVTDDGYIELAEDITKYSEGFVKDDELKGLHLTEALVLLNKRRVHLSRYNELEPAINTYNQYIVFNKRLIDAITYRIIDRGGSKFGPRRALLFAKEFDGNIDIPMQYGVDYSDPGLREFINTYLKAGGSVDLECYNDYFGAVDKVNIGLVSIKELLKTIGDRPTSFYTLEENNLHQRLVNSLSNRINQDEIYKELRIQRKLNKNKKH